MARKIGALAEACAAAATDREGHDVVDRVLGLALEACDAERAFVIRGERLGDGAIEPVVEACKLSGAIRQGQPSRTVALSALDRSVAFVSLDPASDRALRRGRSVRSLGLRWVLGAPLARGSSQRALVLDSRTPVASSAVDDLLQLGRGFAALLSMGPPSPGRGATPARAERPALLVRSPAMEATMAWIERIAPTDLPVLIRGESGTGKEVVARKIHDLSPRRRGPYVAVSCTELPESLIEAELFGSERGAYTGAVRDRPGVFRSAQGGTLLLDEIGDMPLTAQAKLLRALQEKTVRPIGAVAEVGIDVRLLAATHRDLARAVRQGSFRGDLYYRLTVTEIEVPPLRERGADLAPLVEELGQRLARETGFPTFAVSADALALLRAHDWPGNVRELQSVLARALLRSAGAPIEPLHLDEVTPPASRTDDVSTNLELEMINAALGEARGSVARAARSIGWSRQKLYRRMNALSLRGR